MSNQVYEKLLIPKEHLDSIEPFDDQVVIRIDNPIDKDGRIEGKGLILTTSASAEKNARARIFGVILARGPECKYVDVGDKVVFAKYGGTEVYKKEYDPQNPDDKEDYSIRIMGETIILCKYGSTKEKK